MGKDSRKFHRSILVVGTLIGCFLLTHRPLFSQSSRIPSDDWIASGYSECSFSSVHSGWAVGGKCILRFLNGSWEKVALPEGDIGELYGVYFSSPDEGWVVGSGGQEGKAGILLHYFQGSWTLIEYPYVSSNWLLSGVYFPSPSEGWAWGYDAANIKGVLLHYSNGLWTEMLPPYVSSYWIFHSVHFTSVEEGWAVGSDLVSGKAILLHYLNGEWSNFFPPSRDNVFGDLVLEDVYFTKPSEGWAVGYYIFTNTGKRIGCILHYEDGVWTIIDPPKVSSNWILSDVHFVSPTEGWAVGRDYQNSTNGRGVILYYWNGNWKVISTPSTPDYEWYFSSIHFSSPTQGWAIGEGFKYSPWGGYWTAEGIVASYSHSVERIFTSPPIGPKTGYLNGNPNTYSTQSNSNLYHDVEILFDWGDGTNSGWLPVGVTSASKSWHLPGIYFIRAKGRCSLHTNIESDWSDPLMVSISASPIAPQSPANGEVFTSSSLINNYQPVFSWSAMASFLRYEIFFSTSPTDFTTSGVKVSAGSIRGTSNNWKPSLSTWKLIMKASDNNGSIRPIYWKIVGIKADGTITQSEVRSFSIAKPQAVTINSPLNGTLPSDMPPTIDFNLNGNVKFRIEFSPFIDFRDPKKMKAFTYTHSDPNTVTSLSQTLSLNQWIGVMKLVRGTGYFRIKAWDAINRATISEVISFNHPYKWTITITYQNNKAGWVRVDYNATDPTSISLSGTAFISPTWWRCCSGSAEDTGVEVTWKNNAIGAEGIAYHTVKYGGLVWLYDHQWFCSVPLDVSKDNLITIMAADPAGNWGKALIKAKWFPF